MIVYLIRNNFNGKCYVGKTSRSISFRWRQHKTEARIGRRKSNLYEDMRNGDSFTCVILDEAMDQRRLAQLERKYISQYNAAVDGYNQTTASTGGRAKYRTRRVGSPLPEEHKRRISASVKAHHVTKVLLTTDKSVL
jgi:group I intron endonuclease